MESRGGGGFFTHKLNTLTLGAHVGVGGTTAMEEGRGITVMMVISVSLSRS